MYRFSLVSALVILHVLGSQAWLEGDIDLTEGVRLVGVPVSNSLQDETGRSFGENTVLFRMAKFLQGHELHIKLPNLVEKDKLSQVFSESLKAVDETYKENSVSGRGKGGGGGGIALLGMMMAKALGAIGLGGLGLLTMKALAVSALALLLSAVVGVKKLASHEEHDDHKVIYADHHGHHRRRRGLEPIDTPLPYQGWAHYETREQS